jgi:hypothetical protein
VDCGTSGSARVRTEEAVAPTTDLNPTGVGRATAKSSGWGVGEGLRKLARRGGLERVAAAGCRGRGEGGEGGE